MTDTTWFDDEIGESPPANVKRFPLPVKVEKLPHKEDLEAITLALSILAEERLNRPELVATLEKYPALLAEYLTIPRNQKMALGMFRCGQMDYFEDRLWSGDCIHQLTNNYNHAAAMIARKYRWAGQLGKMFDFYLQGEKDVPFNNNYLRKNPALRKRYDSRGATLAKNLYQNNLEVKDIVAIVASARPEILNHYREPGYKSNVNYITRRRK